MKRSLELEYQVVIDSNKSRYHTLEDIYFKSSTDSSLSFSLKKEDTTFIEIKISNITYIGRRIPKIIEQNAALGGAIGLVTIGLLLATPFVYHFEGDEKGDETLTGVGYMAIATVVLVAPLQFYKHFSLKEWRIISKKE